MWQRIVKKLSGAAVEAAPRVREVSTVAAQTVSAPNGAARANGAATAAQTKPAPAPSASNVATAPAAPVAAPAAPVAVQAPTEGESLPVPAWMDPPAGNPSPMVHDNPGQLIDREYIAARGTRWERYAYHHIASQINGSLLAAEVEVERVSLSDGVQEGA